MKLKYRIKRWDYPFAESYFIAQYKIFGLWMNINNTQIGKFTKPYSVKCETLNDAISRIKIHKKNMKRAKNWINRSSIIIWKDNNFNSL